MPNEIDIEFDPVKNLSNFEKHGVSLAGAADFEWETAQIEGDIRFMYPEKRFKAVGFLAQRLHVLIYCLRGEKTRLISFRKANDSEFDEYVDKT